LSKDHFSITFFKGSGYRTIDGSFNLKPYLTISCSVAVMRDENAVGLAETYQTYKVNPKRNHVSEGYFQAGPLGNFPQFW